MFRKKWYSDLTESESRRKVLTSREEAFTKVITYFEVKINQNRPSYDINAARGHFPLTANRSTANHNQTFTPDSILS